MAAGTSSSRRRSMRSVRTLSAVEVDGRSLPRLGKRLDGEVWHPKVKEWWHQVWRSPVAANFDVSDHLSVWELADVKHRRLVAVSNVEIVRMSTEERALSNVLGLNPKARSTQKVDIDRGEQAESRTRRRRNKDAVKAAESDIQVSDPRDVLSA